GTVTSCRVPLEPSMMVMVFDPGGAGFCFAVSGALVAASAAMLCWAFCAPSGAPGCPGWAEGSDLVATTATGSPPRGSWTNAAHATTMRPDRPSNPASIFGALTGSVDGRFRFSWPRGAFRSSGAKAQDPRESSAESSTRRFPHGCCRGYPTRAARKTVGAANRPPRKDSESIYLVQFLLSSVSAPWRLAGKPN